MKKRSVLVALCLMVSGASHAGCGAAFCSSGNDWLTLTQGVTPGWRVWGQVEYINQEQLMEGTRNTSREEINMHHEEIKTINRNFLLGMDYGFSPEWSMGWFCHIRIVNMLTFIITKGCHITTAGSLTRSATHV